MGSFFRKERTYGTLEGPLQMPRKVVKVYLTPKEKQLLERICRRLDMDESLWDEFLHLGKR